MVVHDGTLSVRVVSPARVVHEGLAASVVAPAWDGRVGILPGHAPLLALLGAGELAVDTPGGGSARFFVAGGVLQVEGDRVTVLTEYASRDEPEELPPGLDVVQPEDFPQYRAIPGNPLV